MFGSYFELIHHTQATWHHFQANCKDIHAHTNWFADGWPIKLVVIFECIHIRMKVPLSSTSVQYDTKSNLRNYYSKAIEISTKVHSKSENWKYYLWDQICFPGIYSNWLYMHLWEKSLKVINEQLKLISKTVWCMHKFHCGSNNRLGKFILKMNLHVVYARKTIDFVRRLYSCLIGWSP